VQGSQQGCSCNSCCELLGRDRLFEVVPLSDVAAKRLEQRGLFSGLDALGDHFELERVGHVDDRGGKVGRLWRIDDAADQRAVDLNAIEGQVA
jgi:hypothetical protein